ncbi:hypothetical protein DCMF_11425 [Candidatus Formimonas warabiya]|uniref:DUF2625 domain-containing protein n=2 Tax=Formimonas warabiya TaxID=1761012 RepID=A0A3G1KSB2_FORW1|nr:hypothetical protein DCMF_11425 [Candidatus Formimonas warabiya]
MKSLNELVDQSKSTWLLIQEWISKSAKNIEIIPPNNSDAGKVLTNLQVTTKSVLGSTIYYSGGFKIDNGWLRILGSGSESITRDVLTWNKTDSCGKSTRLPGALLVADDVLGGFYAINGDAFEGAIGNVYYLAPDTLKWESLDMPYSSFLNWVLLGDTDLYYSSFRWRGWENEVLSVGGDSGILFYPFLWSSEKELELRRRSIVPIEEIWNLMHE